jgi:crossover junction endodeoxyribonuclease RuvC
MRTVIGVDPGLASTGWGVVRFDGTRFLHQGHGVITTRPESALTDRLTTIYDELSAVLAEYSPEEGGVEELFFSKNITSAMQVAHARGVVLLALGRRGIPVGFYSPQHVKAAVIGRGTAPKDQVQRLVAVILGLAELPGPDHAADALAIAICHTNRYDHVQQHHG